MCFCIGESIAFFAVIWYIEVKRKPLKTANLFGLEITASVQVIGGYFLCKTKGASATGNTFGSKLNHKLGGVSSISGTLSSVSGAFPTFVVQFIVFPL